MKYIKNKMKYIFGHSSHEVQVALSYWYFQNVCVYMFICSVNLMKVMFT